jgi:multiple sugar transport system substrate-binding protein
MKTSFQITILIILILTCGACETSFTVEPKKATVEVTNTRTSTPKITVTSPEPTIDQKTPDVITIRIWVPPVFNPESGTRAGELLKARLNIFQKRRPEVNIEVRVKAISGPGGLIDSLSTTNAAASLGMPDLIALPNNLLETAALKGFLQPIDQFSEIKDDSDWYSFSKELAQIQGSTYGIPFASDVQSLVYRSNKVEAPPTDWNNTYESNIPLVFSAADVQSLFTLLQYRASGGELLDDEGRPFLDVEVLTKVLSFYQEAELAEVMPYWLTQYQDDEQVWTAFEEKRADMVVTWFSRYLSSEENDILVAPIPTSNGEPYTLATGWIWAFPTQRDIHLEVSLELAAFLTESDFLRIWNQAAGYLPPRSSSIRSWEENELKTVTNQILSSVHLVPTSDVLTSLGGALQQATVQVLKRQDEPLTAAQQAASSLTSP